MEREAMQRLRLSNMWVLSVPIRPRCFIGRFPGGSIPFSIAGIYFVVAECTYFFRFVADDPYRMSLSLLYQNQCAILSLRFCREGRECRKTLAPLVWPIPVGAMVRGGYVSPGLELSVDYTLCLYDISTQTTLVMHPFLFETEQSKKDRRKIQLMQPEGVPVDYPLIDELHEALVAEYDILLRKLGIK